MHMYYTSRYDVKAGGCRIIIIIYIYIYNYERVLASMYHTGWWYAYIWILAIITRAY